MEFGTCYEERSYMYGSQYPSFCNFWLGLHLLLDLDIQLF